MVRIPRAAYADMFGPTTGDRVRLADTDLIVEVERDLTTYGEEVKFGGGKVITRAQVMVGVAEMIHDVQVEATFPDGTKLVTVHEPIR